MAEDRGVQFAQAVGGSRAAARGARLPLTAAQLAQAQLVQQGNDLVIVRPDGTTVQVPGYFASGATPLTLVDGSVLSPETVLGSVTPAAGPTIPPIDSVPASPSRGSDRLRALIGGDSLDSLLANNTGGTPGLSSRGDDRLGTVLGGGDSLDSILGPSRTVGGSSIASLPALGLPSPPPSPTTVTPVQRLPTEIVTAPTVVPVTPAPGGNAPGTPGSGGNQPPAGSGNIDVQVPLAPTATFSRSPLAVDVGNPGGNKPNLMTALVLGDSNSNSYDQSFPPVLGPPTIILLNDGNGTSNNGFTLSIFDSVANQTFSTHYVTADVAAADNQLTFNAGPNFGTFIFDLGADFAARLPSTINFPLADAFVTATGWIEPVADAYAGLGGNDSINGSTGNDVLLGDFDLPASGAFGAFITGSADDVPPDGFVPGADTIIGGSGADTMYGGGGADSVTGGSGDDVVYVTDLGFALVDGGDFGSQAVASTTNNPGVFATSNLVQNAIDSLLVLGSNLSIDLTDPTILNRIQKFEAIDLGQSTGNSLIASPGGVLGELSESVGDVNDPTAGALFILGDGGDTVQLTEAGWTLVRSDVAGNTLEISAPADITFEQYTNVNGGNPVSVYIQTAIEVQLA
jgi:hypothetical protein